MTDFSDMIRDALTGGPAFEPQSGRLALDRAMERYDRRARTMRWVAFLSLAAMNALMVWGVFFIITGDAGDTRMTALNTFLAIAGITGISITKLWFFVVQNHLMVMRELKGLEFLILRTDSEVPGGTPG